VIPYPHPNHSSQLSDFLTACLTPISLSCIIPTHWVGSRFLIFHLLVELPGEVKVGVDQVLVLK
jgi:hypothetical protein